MKIAPSVLSLDYATFKESLIELNKYADWLQKSPAKAGRAAHRPAYRA